MSFTQADRNSFLRYCVGFAGVLLLGFVLSALLGIRTTIRLWALVAAVAVGVTLIFLYLFYRLVVALEQIANRL